MYLKFLNTLSYCASLRLPSEYQEVHSLEATGTQYVDTGIVFDKDKQINVDALCTSGTVWGVGVSGNANTTASDSGGSIYMTLGDYYAFGFGRRIYKYNTIDHKLLKSEDFGVTFIEVKQYTRSGDFVPSETISIGAAHQGGYIATLIGIIYSVEILDNTSGTPLAVLVPCYRISDSKTGFYDIIRNIFLPNLGTNEFIIE